MIYDQDVVVYKLNRYLFRYTCCGVLTVLTSCQSVPGKNENSIMENESKRPHGLLTEMSANVFRMDDEEDAVS